MAASQVEPSTDPLAILNANLDDLARLIHGNYASKERERNPHEAPEFSTWESLPASLKESNRRQAATIPNKLGQIGCRVGAKGEQGQEVKQFSQLEIESLARYEHELWTAERAESGWALAREKQVVKKETPYITSYDELADDIKELDRDAVRNILPLLHRLGLRVYRGC